MAHHKNRNATLDYLKFISAVLVVFIHTAGQAEGGSINGLGAWQAFQFSVWAICPVEIFIIISAYYLFRGSFDFSTKTFKREKYTQCLKHYIMLYLGWSILYLPNLLWRIAKGNLTENILLVVRRLFVTGMNGSLWYMLGIIYSMIVIRVLFAFFKDYQVGIIAILIFCISLLGSSYFHLLDGLPNLEKILLSLLRMTGHFYIMRVPIYMMIGYFFAKIDLGKTICCISSKRKMVGCLVWVFAVLMQTIERKIAINYQLGRDYPAFIFGLLVAPALFCIALAYQQKSNYISTFLGYASSVIYFSHGQAITVIAYLNGNDYNWLMMIVTLFIGIVFAAGIKWIQRWRMMRRIK